MSKGIKIPTISKLPSSLTYYTMTFLAPKDLEVNQKNLALLEGICAKAF